MRRRSSCTPLYALLLLLAALLPLAPARSVIADEARTGTSFGALEVVLAFLEAHDPSYVAEDAVWQHMWQPEPLHGREAVAAMLRDFYEDGFADSHFEVHKLVADGNKVVGEGVLYGTHTGDFMGMPATGRSIELPIIAIFVVEDGSITEGRLYYDVGTMLAQLGMMEEP